MANFTKITEISMSIYLLIIIENTNLLDSDIKLITSLNLS